MWECQTSTTAAAICSLLLGIFIDRLILWHQLKPKASDDTEQTISLARKLRNSIEAFRRYLAEVIKRQYQALPTLRLPSALLPSAERIDDLWLVVDRIQYHHLRYQVVYHLRHFTIVNVFLGFAALSIILDVATRLLSS